MKFTRAFALTICAATMAVAAPAAYAEELPMTGETLAFRLRELERFAVLP